MTIEYYEKIGKYSVDLIIRRVDVSAVREYLDGSQSQKAEVICTLTVNGESCNLTVRFETENPIVESIIIYHVSDMAICMARKIGFRVASMFWRRIQMQRRELPEKGNVEILRLAADGFNKEMRNKTLSIEFKKGMKRQLAACVLGSAGDIFDFILDSK